MANAVVVTGGAVSEAEALRVLVPVRGRAWVDGKELTGPMPANFGEWTHWAGKAENNKTNPETGLQIPNAVRWMAGPWYGDGINPNGWRLSGGLAAAELNIGGGLNVEVRDAFNGVPLWRQTYGNGSESDKSKPTILINGVFMRPDETAAGRPLAAFKATTGEKLRVFEGTLTGGGRGKGLLSYGAVASDGFVFYSGENTVKCFEISTGKETWSSQHPRNLVKPTKAGGLIVLIEEGE